MNDTGLSTNFPTIAPTLQPLEIDGGIPSGILLISLSVVGGLFFLCCTKRKYSIYRNSREESELNKWLASRSDSRGPVKDNTPKK